LGEAFAWAVESTEEPVAEWGFIIEGEGTELTLHMHVTLGPAPSQPRTMAAADPDNADEIIARRFRHWLKNMTATV
jgi:hypothetical protein